MHTADGVLSPLVCGVAGAAAAVAVGWSLKRLQDAPNLRAVPLTAVLAGLIFAGQMVNFRLPIPGVVVSGHLIGGVLAAVIAGPWGGCLALTLVLFVQLLLFSDGGWLAYGANVLNMGVIGSLGGYVVFDFIRRRIAGPRGVIAGTVIASWVSVLAASTLFCVEFLASHPGMLAGGSISTLFTWMTVYHSIIGVGEGLIAGLVVSYVVAVRPDVIYDPKSQSGWIANAGQMVWTGVIAALLVAAFLAPFASGADDGLEKALGDNLGFKAEGEPRTLVLPDYEVPLPGVDASEGLWKKISVAVAGLLGTGVVLGLAFALSRAAGPVSPTAIPP